MTLTMYDALPVPITKLVGLMSWCMSEFVWMNLMHEIYLRYMLCSYRAKKNKVGC